MLAHPIRHVGLLAALITTSAGAAMLFDGQTAAGGGGCRGVPPTEDSGNAVSMNESCFLPTVLRAEPGTVVSFTNQSEQPHTVSGANTEWGNYNELRSAETIKVTFDKPGTYPYFCFLHPGMIGAVVVGSGSRGESGPPPVVKAVSAATADAPVPSQPSTSVVAGSSGAGNDRDLALAGGLGVLLGAVAVGAGVGARSRTRRK